MDRSDNAQGKMCGLNPDEITPAWKTKRKEKSGALMWILAVRPNLRMKMQTCIHVVQGAVRLKTIPSSITLGPNKRKLSSGTNRKNWPRSKLGTLAGNADKVGNLLARNPRFTIFAIIS